MRGSRLLLAAAAALAATSPAAQASTVWNNAKTESLFELTVRGEPGEANDVTVGGPTDDQWTVRDATARLTTREGCQSVDANNARCSAAQSFGMLLVLEDGNDRASFATQVGGSGPVPPAKVYGGDGDDTLSTGDEGQQDLFGDDGNDTLTKTGAEREYFDGGAGDDRIRTVDGQSANYTEGDVVYCGDGADVVEADQLDTVDPDCETVTRTEIQKNTPEGGGDSDRQAVPSIPALPARGLKVSASGTVPVPVRCGAGGGECRDGQITVKRRGGAVLGRTGFDMSAGEERRIAVPLSKRARRLVRRKRKVAAAVTIVVGGAIVKRNVTLRR